MGPSSVLVSWRRLDIALKPPQKVRVCVPFLWHNCNAALFASWEANEKKCVFLFKLSLQGDVLFPHVSLLLWILLHEVVLILNDFLSVHDRDHVGGNSGASPLALVVSSTLRWPTKKPPHSVSYCMGPPCADCTKI